MRLRDPVPIEWDELTAAFFRRDLQDAVFEPALAGSLGNRLRNAFFASLELGGWKLAFFGLERGAAGCYRRNYSFQGRRNDSEPRMRDRLETQDVMRDEPRAII